MVRQPAKILTDTVVNYKGVEKFPKLAPIYKTKELSRFAKEHGFTDTIPVAEFVIQEKLDGANARIYRIPGTTTLRAYSRSTLVGEIRSETDFDGDFRGFVPYIAKYYKVFLEHIPEDVMIYGEWLVKHSVQYPDDMYGKFYVFPRGAEAPSVLPSTNILGRISINLFPTKEEHEVVLRKLQEIIQQHENATKRNVEGVVLYYQGTPVFKFVPERLQEKVSSTKKVGSQQKEFEVPEVPERTLEKRLHDAFDRLNISAEDIPPEKLKAIFGVMSHMVWEDFVRELLPDAILDKKNKSISLLNLKALKTTINDSIRKFLKEREIL